MTLLIDNYDSFTFNVYQLIESLGETCKVVRNDEITIEGIRALAPDRLVISPGPGNPDEAGVTLEAITAFAGVMPILGICLGHQAIGQAFGGKVVRARTPKHGKRSLVSHDKKGLFQGVRSPVAVARYHSLVVERESLPKCLKITCETEDGLIMGLRHKTLPIEGLQFHPESVATDCGRDLLARFLETQIATRKGA